MKTVQCCFTAPQLQQALRAVFAIKMCISSQSGDLFTSAQCGQLTVRMPEDRSAMPFKATNHPILRIGCTFALDLRRILALASM